MATLIEHGFFPLHVELTVLAFAYGHDDIASRIANRTRLETYTQAPRLTFATALLAFLLFPIAMLRHKPDVVILSLTQANIIGRLWLRFFPRVHVIAFEHVASTPSMSRKRRIYTSLNKLLARRVDALWADSAATLTTRRDQYPQCLSEATVVPLFVAPTDIAPSCRLDDSGPFHLVTAARLIGRKRVHEIITVVAKLHAAGVDARLTIFGDGPERTALSVQSEACGVGDVVSFAGYVPSWFRHAKGHAFVNYSANEGLCITNLEAMSAGLPLVTTPVGAIPDYATDGETAFIVNSPAELLSALLRIHTDPYAAGQIANRAAARVRQVYSLENLQALGSRLFPISRP